MSIHTRRTAATAIAVAACLGFAGFAFTQTSAQDAPILTISGKVNASDSESGLTFGRADLESMGVVSFETMTPWYKQPVRFEGVPLDKLMQKVGASGQRVVAMALNDYSTEIPIDDFAKHHAILAIKRDGEYMPVRDKGPRQIESSDFEEIFKSGSQTEWAMRRNSA